MCDGSVQRAIGPWTMTKMKVEAAMATIEYIDDIRSCFFCSFRDIPIYYHYYLCVINQMDLMWGEGEGKKGIG